MLRVTSQGHIYGRKLIINRKVIKSGDIVHEINNFYNFPFAFSMDNAMKQIFQEVKDKLDAGAFQKLI